MVHTAQQRIADLQAELQIYQSQHTVKDTVKDQSLAQHEAGGAEALLATRDVELDKLRCAMQAMKARMSQNDAASAAQMEELEAMRKELQRSKAELGNLQCAVGLPETPSVALPKEMHAAADAAHKMRAQLAGSSSSMVASGVSVGVGVDMAAKLAAAEARMKAMMEQMEAQRGETASAFEALKEANAGVCKQ